MKTGQLRVTYWAVGSDGGRAELLATTEQRSDGRFDAVYTSDPRPIDVVLELRDGDGWREVRARRTPGGPSRTVPTPYDP